MKNNLVKVNENLFDISEVLKQKKNEEFEISVNNTIEKIDMMFELVKDLHDKSIKLEDENAMDIENEKLNKELEDNKNRIKEVEKEMRKISKIDKINTQFLLVSTTTITLSLMFLLVFSVTGKSLVNPIFYIILFAMGLGWEVTAITSVVNNRRK